MTDDHSAPDLDSDDGDEGGWLDPDFDAAETQAEKVLRAAYRYAKAGYRVHPLRPGTRIPILNDWPNEASTDPETIATWFGPGAPYEGYNLGIATGRESNLWVLDIDLGKEPKAALSIARLVADNGIIGDTRKVTTPSGGFHYWFQWPDEVPDPATGEMPTWRNIASTVLGDGIDVRAEGGQIAVWPSVTPQGAYSEGDGPIYPVPTWLAEKTRHKPKTNTGFIVRKTDLPDAAQGRAEAYALVAINRVLGDLDELSAAKDPSWAPGNERGYGGRPWNDTCFKVAMRLLDFVAADWAPLSETDAFNLFIEHAPRDRWFTDDTVATIWSSAYRGHDGSPATLPEEIRSPTDTNFFGTGARTNPTVTAGTQANPDGSPKPPDIALPLLGGPRGDKVLLQNVAKVIAEDTLAFGRDQLTWSYEAGVWRQDPNAVTKRAARLLGNNFSAGQVPTITAHLRADPSTPVIGDGTHEHLVNTRSGMVDWKTGMVEPHSPDFRSTIQLPVEYKPEATCPRFDTWLAEVASPEVAARIWQVIGYMALNGNPLQKAVLLYGAGGNGKGTLIRVLTAMLGPWNCSAVSLRHLAEGKSEVAHLYGKQANLAGDIDASHLKDTATFKQITGQDVLYARHLYQSGFEFTAHATPLFSANELWRSSDNSEGYHRRWVIVPMTVRVKDLGRRLDERDLLAELPGIFAKAIAALRGLMAEGDFHTGGLETLMAEEDFKQQSDLVRIWLTEDDAIRARETHSDDLSTLTARGAIYARFKVWAASNGVGQLSSTKFYRRLNDLGYAEHRRATIRGYLGFDIAANADGFSEMPAGSWNNGGLA